MKKGLLIYDKKDSEHNSWFIKKLITEGAKEGLAIDLVLTEDIAEPGDCNMYDFAIVRNRDHALAAELEHLGLRCFNSSEVVRLGNDKWEMYEAFKDKNIPLMYTQTTKLPYPFVLKKRNGHGGSSVYLVNNADEYKRVQDIIWNSYKKQNDNAYVSVDNLIKEEYIYQLKATDTGRDIRVYILGGHILTAMERTSDTDFRANFSLGGKACEYALLSDEMALAAKAADLIKPDFIGIDIIYNNGSPVLNEIEDAVGTRMLYEYTDIDAAGEYIRYIKNNI